jgi:hypothetical protein
MLEIWTTKDHDVLVRDPQTGESRILVDVASVAFADGTVIPARDDRRLTGEPRLVQTLAGPVAVG